MTYNLFGSEFIFVFYALIWLTLIFFVYFFVYEPIEPNGKIRNKRESYWRYLLFFITCYGLADVLDPLIKYDGLNALTFFNTIYVVPILWISSLIFLHLFLINASKFLIPRLKLTYKTYLIVGSSIVLLVMFYDQAVWQISSYLLLELTGIAWLFVLLFKYQKRSYVKKMNLKPAVITVAIWVFLNFLIHINFFDLLLSLDNSNIKLIDKISNVSILFFYGVKCLVLYLIVFYFHRNISLLQSSQSSFSLQKKLAINLKSFLVISIILAFVGASWINSIKNNRLTILQQQNQHDLLIIRNMWDTHVKFAQNIVYSMVRSPIFYDIEKKMLLNINTIDSINNVLDRYCRTISSITADCYFLNLEGKILASSNRLSQKSFVGKNHIRRKYFQNAIKAGPTISELLESHYNKSEYYITHSVYNIRKEMIGVVTIDFDFDQKILKKIDPTLDSLISIVNNVGTILFSNEKKYNFRDLWPSSLSQSQSQLKFKIEKDIVDNNELLLGPIFSKKPDSNKEVLFEKKIHTIFFNESQLTPLYFVAISSLNEVSLISLIGFVIVVAVGIMIFMTTMYFNKISLMSKILHDKERKFRLIIENSTDFIYQVDTKGGLIYCSPAVIKDLRYNPEEIIGTNFTHYIYSEDIEIANNIFFQNIRGHKTCNKLRLISKTGELVFVECNAGPIRDEQGDILGAQGHIRVVKATVIPTSFFVYDQANEQAITL
ncbi:MAG: PAS domain S-box protein [Oligoflexia bacterium]|nr:PAS domain S-box protein [Oligoflexia bacterium]